MLHGLEHGFGWRSIRLIHNASVVDENVEVIELSHYCRRRILRAFLSLYVELDESRVNLLFLSELCRCLAAKLRIARSDENCVVGPTNLPGNLKSNPFVRSVIRATRLIHSFHHDKPHPIVNSVESRSARASSSIPAAESGRSSSTAAAWQSEL